jgi:hypothetical protein
MRNRILVALAALAVLAGVVYFAVFRASDEEKIRAQLAKLSESVEVKEGGSNPVFRKARLDADFEKIFDEDVRVSIPDLSSTKPGRANLVALAMQASVWARSASVELSKIEVKLDDAHQSAKVGATATVRAVSGSGRNERDERAVDFRFAKIDGTWKITSLTVWRKDEARPD